MITQVVKMHQRTLKEHCGSYPHELIRQFLKTHFFYPGSVFTGPLQQLRKAVSKTMRFRCPDSLLVSCERKAFSCKKVCGFKNIGISVD